MRNILQLKPAKKSDASVYTAMPQVSNVRGITITDTAEGTLIGVLLAGAADCETSVESLTLQVRVAHGNQQQMDIDVLMRDALHEALQVIQHELKVCAARNGTQGQA